MDFGINYIENIKNMNIKWFEEALLGFLPNKVMKNWYFWDTFYFCGSKTKQTTKKNELFKIKYINRATVY